MIEIKNLRKIYKANGVECIALDNINLSIGQGETVAIMGKSGAGKTTLMNIIGCLDKPTSGKYFMEDIDITRLHDKRLSQIRNEKIGFVFQDFALLPQKSVIFNVMLPMYFDKTSYIRMKQNALSALTKTGVADQRHKKVKQLSGGQKQRVAIARALVKSPQIILADEPTGALDTDTGRSIMSTLMKMNNSGTTIIVVTHDEQIAAYCKRRIIISDGKIVDDNFQKFENLQC